MKKIVLLVSVLTLLFAQCSNEEQSPEQMRKKDGTQTTAQKNKDVKFKATSEKIAEAEEIFQLKYEVNAEVENFNPPDFGEFDVVSGPMTSSFSSMQIINGKRSNSVTNSYIYNISCSELGTFTIKPAEVVIDGQTYKSDSLQIKIIGDKANSKNNSKISKNKNQKINSKEAVFLRTDFSKTSVYNGEFITVTTKIYTKKEFSNISEIHFPDFPGFWTKALQEPRQLKFHNELVNGKKYSVALLKQTLLFAVKPGKFTISPYEITLQIKKKDGKARDFFGQIVDNYKLINKRLKTKKQIIVVKPLPKPLPENFSGFTGKNVSVKAEIDTRKFKTDESANLKITVSGTGNLYLLNDLQLNLPNHLKYFKPETELNDKYTEFGEIGDRIFNFIIVADKAGNYQIPSIDFVWFDSETKTYKRVSTKTIDIQVGKGKAYVEHSDEGKVLSNKDIRYIKRDNFKLTKNEFAFTTSLLFYLLYPLLALIFLAVLYFRKKYMIANADIKKVKKKKAGKVSQKKLKTALKYMNEQKKDDFYREILQSIWGYLSDKLSVDAVALTKETIEEILHQKNLDKALTENLLNLVDDCGYAQYTSTSSETEMEKIYNEAARIINELENKLS